MGPAGQERTPLCGVDHGAALEVHRANVGEESVSRGCLEQRQQVWRAAIAITSAQEQPQRDEHIEQSLDQAGRYPGPLTQVGQAACFGERFQQSRFKRTSQGGESPDR